MGIAHTKTIIGQHIFSLTLGGSNWRKPFALHIALKLSGWAHVTASWSVGDAYTPEYEGEAFVIFFRAKRGERLYHSYVSVGDGAPCQRADCRPANAA